MKKRVNNLRILAAAGLIVLALCSVALFFFSAPLGIAAGALCIALAVFAVVLSYRYRRVLKKLLKNWVNALDPQRMEMICAFPMPCVAVTADGDMLYANARFAKDVLDGGEVVGRNITQVFSGITLKDLAKKTTVEVECAAHKLTAYINRIPEETATYVVYFADNTTLKDIAAEYTASRPVAMMLCIDNLEEATVGMRESARVGISGQIEIILDEWIIGVGGIIRKIGAERFMAVVENRHLNAMAKDRFSVLDRVRSACAKDGLTITLSIGVGQGKTMQECESMAQQALEMALARGGDQAAIKTVNGFDFYGGRSKGVEKRTKVRTRVMANALCDLIRSSDRVFVMGHRLSDLDSLGSAVALTVAARQLGVEAYAVVNEQATMARELIGRYEAEGRMNVFLSPSGALDTITERSLLIVTDTHAESMLDSRELYEAAARVAIIDHHRKMINHIQNPALEYHQPSSSSACELVTELVQYMGNALIGRLEAEALLSGIMLDTRNFVLSTGVRTFEAAAYLRRLGADTVSVKRMFSDNLSLYQKKFDLVSKAEVYRNCAIVATQEDFSAYRAVAAQAADEMLAIRGIVGSFVICRAGDEVIVSARSFGECNVQLVMEAMGGGGHLTMAGTQLKETTVEQVRDQLCAALDTYYGNQNT